MKSGGGEVPASAHEPVPFTMDVQAGQCLAWYHRPEMPWRNLVVVLCAPIGYEAVTSHATFVQMARGLAARGFPVVAFDGLGSGDSSGDDRHPDRLAAWRAGIDAAIDHAQRLDDSLQVCLLGVGLGGTLALDAACRLGNIESLVLWGSTATGRSFMRQSIAAGLCGPQGCVHALGHHYTAETLQSLADLQPLASDVRPVRRVLAIDRDDLPGQGKALVEALRLAGTIADRLAIPGYAKMARGGLEGALDGAALDALGNWLAAGASPGRLDPPPSLETTAPSWTADGCHETLVRLGAQRLCGILSEPFGRRADGARPTIVLLNDGENYHVGSHRLYVTLARELARAGHRVVRLDFAGTGDSPDAPDAVGTELYAMRSVREVRAVLDALTEAGHRSFVLAGLCSGSFLAFQTGLKDRRVSGLALLNPRLLAWNPRKGESWQHAHELQVRSARAYGKALSRRSNWHRLAQGELGLQWALKVARAIAEDGLHQLAWAIGIGRPTLRATLRGLCQQGVDVLVLLADDDDAVGYIEHHVGPGGRHMRGVDTFTMAVLKDADHTFSRPGNVETAAAHLVRFLEQARRPHEEREADGRVPAIVGTS
ncbi:alpha/beta fold hydrolase [Ramlibacter sp. MMS24-I3-19]|uniref:alpha/beta fold hydrolase n=1 Tax=Ramlibacter sp. MMS24-I3-19 TaxID=3416606 RepID=UPI003D094CD7